MAACERSLAPPPSAAPGSVAAPIVGGVVEGGWPSVGALTSRVGNDYQGAHCTGALVAPRWVLTAAHCVDDARAPWRVPEDVWFYLGADARPGEGGALPEGRLVKVDAALTHPEYDAGASRHDLALLHLAEAVDDVAPLIPNEQNLRVWFDDWSEAEPPELLVVGFGATEGIALSGAGVKRSVTLTLDGVSQDVFFSDFVAGGVCSGDSGGPALLELAPGTTRLVGIASAHESCPPSDPSCDPCHTGAHFLRIDVDAEWIATTLETALDCRVQTTLCECAAACTDDGTCDPGVACPQADCADTHQCVRQCAGAAACEGECRAAAGEAALAELTALVACFEAGCSGLSSWESYVCRQQACPDAYEGCFHRPAFGTGDAACPEVSSCIDACPPSSACYDECFGRGSAEVQRAHASMADCIVAECSDEVTMETYEACVRLACHDELGACYPTATGEMGCGFVDACRRACALDDGACGTDCYARGTDEAQRLYDALRWCDAHHCEGTGDPMGCRATYCGTEDLACRMQGAGGSCEGGEPCAPGLVCRAGVCVAPCVDADDDGVCAPEDCADDDATIAPDAPEVCGNTRDDDCDGATDEGCSTDVPTPAPAAGDDGGCGGSEAPSGLVVLAAAALALGLTRRRTSGRAVR